MDQHLGRSTIFLVEQLLLIIRVHKGHCKWIHMINKCDDKEWSEFQFLWWHSIFGFSVWRFSAASAAATCYRATDTPQMVYIFAVRRWLTERHWVNNLFAGHGTIAALADPEWPDFGCSYWSLLRELQDSGSKIYELIRLENSSISTPSSYG